MMLGVGPELTAKRRAAAEVGRFELGDRRRFDGQQLEQALGGVHSVSVGVQWSGRELTSPPIPGGTIRAKPSGSTTVASSGNVTSMPSNTASSLDPNPLLDGFPDRPELD